MSMFFRYALTDVPDHESNTQHIPTYINETTKPLPARTVRNATAGEIFRLTSLRSPIQKNLRSLGLLAFGMKFKVQESLSGSGFRHVPMICTHCSACAIGLCSICTTSPYICLTLRKQCRKFDSNRGDFKVVKKRVYVVSPQSMSNLGQTRTSELAAHPLHGSLPCGENKTTMVRPSIENFEPKTGTCQKRAIATYSHH